MIIHCIIFLHHNLLKNTHCYKYNVDKLYESAVVDMTAISNKYKNKAKEKLAFVSGREWRIVVLCFFAGLCSGGASWCDVSLPWLCIVMAYCSEYAIYRFSILAGGLISTGITAISNSEFIPYFLSVAIFAVLSKTLTNQKYSTIISLSVMALTKVILVYYYLSVSYKVWAIMEAVMVYFVMQVAKEGTQHILCGADVHSFTDLTNCIIAMVCISIAFSGADSHWLYPGFALVLGCGWYFISAGKFNLAFVALITCGVSLADKRGFVYILLCAGLLWLSGGYFAERLSLGIYPMAVVFAFALNILFITQINSFAVMGSVLLALVIYFLLPYTVKILPQTTSVELVAGRDWRLLMVSLKKLENTLAFLAGCVIDISRLNDKNLKTDNLEDIVAEDVCRRCEKNTVCWQEKYSFTHQRFCQYSQKMYWEGDNKFSTAFCYQCIKTGDVIKSFEENARLLLSKKYIQQSQKNNQKLLQTAFVSVSSAVGDLVYKNQHSYLLNSTFTMETDRFLKDAKINHTYCLCSQNPDQIIFSSLESVDEKILYKIQCFAEKLYGVKFSQPAIEQQSSELLYIFSARPLFDYETAVESSRYKLVNGDNAEIFEYNGCAYILLSDGMGTGNMAAAESHTVISMAKSLIIAGVSIKTMIDMINLSLNLKGSGETSASLDILCADLFTGKCTITKAGAGVSMVLGKNGLSRYYADSLPLGIVKDVKAVECELNLQSGDTLIMMSDGVGVISGDIKNMYGHSCKRIAQHINNMNDTADDKTVVVLKLKLAV